MQEVHYLIGNTCNLSCPFCIHPDVTAELPFSFQKKIIDEIASAKISKITISGGEPLMVPHIKDVLEYIHSKGIECILHTNGLLLTKSLFKEIAPYISRLSLTLDAIKEEHLLLMRSNDSILKHTLECISWANENCVSVSVKTLITKINKPHIEELGSLIQNIGVSHRTLIPFLPIERGLFSKDIFYLEDTESRKIIDTTKKMFPHISIRDHMDQVERKYCFITAEGVVYTNKQSGEKLYISDLNQSHLSDIILQYF